MNLATRNYEEKRDFIRMKVNCNAIITTADGQKSTGYCHNLSGGGALLELTQKVPLNEPLQVTINSHYGHAPVFSTLGKVVRSQAKEATSNFWVAIQY
jgi:hypothetical protein